MRRIAAGIGVIIAVTLPLGYFIIAFNNQGNLLFHEAKFVAERVAEYAYLQGSAWAFAEERITDLISDSHTSSHRLYIAIALPDGSMVARLTNAPDWPFHSATAPVLVFGQQVATVTAAETMSPILLKTFFAVIFSSILALGALVAMHLLPLRALDRTLERLQQALSETKAHAAETEHAYEELKRQHRLVEETTQELMGARDAAQDASRTKSAFLATMSHELRTPLNAVIGFSQMLTNEVYGPLGSPRYQEYCRMISESGRHLLSIINDVLDISKMEAGKLELHLEDVDVAELLQSCQRLVGGKVEEAGIALHLDLPEEPLPLLRADPVKLKQIVLNLLSNALKFTPHGGRIDVSLGRLPGGEVRFQVRDTGIGMSDEEVALALQPFRQVDNRLTRKYEGTGLGLPLAEALIKHHGGELQVQSKPGVGTTVVVVLPLDPVDQAAAE